MQSLSCFHMWSHECPINSVLWLRPIRNFKCFPHYTPGPLSTNFCHIASSSVPCKRHNELVVEFHIWSCCGWPAIRNSPPCELTTVEPRSTRLQMQSLKLLSEIWVQYSSDQGGQPVLKQKLHGKNIDKFIIKISKLIFLSVWLISKMSKLPYTFIPIQTPRFW